MPMVVGRNIVESRQAVSGSLGRLMDNVKGLRFRNAMLILMYRNYVELCYVKFVFRDKMVTGAVVRKEEASFGHDCQDRPVKSPAQVVHKKSCDEMGVQEPLTFCDSEPHLEINNGARSTARD